LNASGAGAGPAGTSRLTVLRTLEEAELLAGALRDAGLAVFVIDKIFHAEPIPMSRLFNRVELHTPADQLRQAERVLAELGKAARRCPHCGSHLFPNELHCEACGESPPAA
jgi:hypothetical protein